MNRQRRETRLVLWRKGAIRRMTSSREATLRLLERMPEGEIRRRATQGRWSIKDVLAHIIAWEEEGIRRLELIRQGHGDKIFFYDDMRVADRFNARAVAAARRVPLPVLLRRMARVRARLIDCLLRVPPHLLEDPAQRYPVRAWLPEFAWTHERLHLARIRDWWRRERSSR